MTKTLNKRIKSADETSTHDRWWYRKHNDAGMIMVTVYFLDIVQTCAELIKRHKFRLNFAWIPEIPRYQSPQEGQTLTPSQWHTSKQSDTGDESGWTSTSKERWFRVCDCQNFTECLHCATKAQDTSTHLLRARKPRLCMFLAFAIAMMFCLWHQHSCFKS